DHQSTPQPGRYRGAAHASGATAPADGPARFQPGRLRAVALPRRCCDGWPGWLNPTQTSALPVPGRHRLPHRRHRCHTLLHARVAGSLAAPAPLPAPALASTAARIVWIAAAVGSAPIADAD